MKIFIICVMCLAGFHGYGQPQNLANTNSSSWKIVQPWKNIKVSIIEMNQAGQPSVNNMSENLMVKAAGYQDPSKPKDYGVWKATAIYDPAKHQTSIFPLGGDFFVYNDSNSETIAYSIDSSQRLCWQTSCIQILDSDGGMDKAIRQFEIQFDNSDKLYEFYYKYYSKNEIDLHPSLPKEYFDAGSDTTSMLLNPEGVRFEEGNLRMDVRNQKSKKAITLWIDLKAKKVVRSVVDGVEMDINTGKGYAIPLPKK